MKAAGIMSLHTVKDKHRSFMHYKYNTRTYSDEREQERSITFNDTLNQFG